MWGFVATKLIQFLEELLVANEWLLLGKCGSREDFLTSAKEFSYSQRGSDEGPLWEVVILKICG